MHIDNVNYTQRSFSQIFPTNSICKNMEYNWCSFKDAEIENIIFENCKFINCSFESTTIYDTCFKNTSFNMCNFQKSHWVDTKLENALIRKCSLKDIYFFHNIVFENTTFLNSTIGRIDKNNSKFKFIKCKIHKVIFNDISFIGCKIYDTFFKTVSFKDLDFSNVIIRNSTLRDIAFDKVTFHEEAEFRNTTIKEYHSIDTLLPIQLVLHKKTDSRSSSSEESLGNYVDSLNVYLRNKKENVCLPGVTPMKTNKNEAIRFTSEGV